MAQARICEACSALLLAITSRGSHHRPLLQGQDPSARAADSFAEQGVCASCIGPVDGTLGTCDGLPNCLSTFDDRPDHFLTPWEYTGDPVRTAGAALEHSCMYYVRY
jgi:hypothetical protein